MLVLLNAYETFHTKYEGTLIIYHHTKFHMVSNGSLLITIKLKAKYRFHGPAMLFHTHTHTHTQYP